jgi:hypothetical protein
LEYCKTQYKLKNIKIFSLSVSFNFCRDLARCRLGDFDLIFHNRFFKNSLSLSLYIYIYIYPQGQPYLPASPPKKFLAGPDDEDNRITTKTTKAAASAATTKKTRRE